MKRFTGLNFYELLEVSPTASQDQIRQAYDMARSTYAEDSMVTYSLFDPQSRKDIMNRIEQAYSILGDEKRRRDYDREIGVRQEERGTTGTTGGAVPEANPPERTGPVPVPSPPPTSRPRTAITARDEDITGPFLKSVREKQEIPLQEIADQTRINITYLDYIERENFRTLPAEVYLKGYLEQLARYLGLEPAVVVRGYLRILREWKDRK